MSLSLREGMRRYLPPWLVDRPTIGKTTAFRLLYSFGVLADVGVQRIVESVRARFPTMATPTSLPQIGRDRRIARGWSEPDETYAQRLRRWRPDWQSAGSPYTLMRQVRAYLWPALPLMRVVDARGTWYTLNADDTVERVVGANWDWDGDTSRWARFWLVIYADGLWTRDGTWDDGDVWGDHGDAQATWGSSATYDQVRAIRAIVGDWKAAHAACVNIIVVFDAEAFTPADTSPPLPDGTWAHWSKLVGGVQVHARDDRAIYWDGVA